MGLLRKRGEHFLSSFALGGHLLPCPPLATPLKTKSLMYLRALFNSEASCDEEVKSRLAIARQRMSELDPIWKSRTVSNKLKARLIEALVWPIVTHRAQRERGSIRAAVLPQGNAHLLCGACSLTNGDVLRRLGQTKSRKLKYLGHIARHIL